MRRSAWQRREAASLHSATLRTLCIDATTIPADHTDALLLF